MHPSYTPFYNLSDSELAREVCGSKAPTDMELELLLRLEHANETIEGLLEQLEQLRNELSATPRTPRYRDAA
ncbi:MAG: hypothetical protein RJA63_1419 [Pseudomonadota bacterium]|jgi:hypothetical protein